MTAAAPDSWYHEKESAWLYRQVAAAEADPNKRDLFLKLAAAADEQALQWVSGAAPRPFTPAVRARLVAWLAGRLGVRAVLPLLAAMKVRGLSLYRSPPPAGHPMPTSSAQVGARHRSAFGGSLRAAVFGINDGLVSNVSLVLGVAGAGSSASAVLTAGAAGLLAGALSMAAGEYISVRSQREMYEYQIALEREELAEYPDEEAEELALIYQARGVELQQARALTRTLMQHPQQALDVLAREELGLNPDDLGSPWRAASASFATFALGAAIPLVPFLLHLDARGALWVAVAVTLVALFAVGLGLSLFTGRSALRSALRMVLIGGGAGLVSFLVGRALGVVTG
ncbi:MAG TPA: VIT1/CCC1 transporter family protein [Steroidobacteraceae bacterium]|nr:VIT1/CCC1 transporter family protein [Steroidobacteraceae bacterium]